MKDKSHMAGYVRVSTTMQVERGDSLAAQEDRLKAEAKRRNWQLTVYREEGISAKDANRPAYQRMREALRTGEMQGVVATKLDRIWRSLKLAINEIDTVCREWKRELITLDQKIDTSTASGRAMLGTLLVFGEFEREMVGERVREAMRHRAEQGKWNGGPTPFGFVRTGKGKLEIQETEAAVVRQIFDLYLQKRTTRSVCHALNRLGIKSRQGRGWALNTIRRILTRPLYVGELIYNKRDTSGKHRSETEHIHARKAVPVIVDRETFEAAQALFKSRYLPPRSQASHFVLAGMVKCQQCGSTMSGQAMYGSRDRKLPESKRGKKHRYYRCYNYVQKGPNACSAGGVRADDLEKVILRELSRLKFNRGELKKYEREQHKRGAEQITPLKREVGRLEGELARLPERDESIKWAYEGGDYDRTELRARLAKLRAHGEKLEADREAARQRLAQAKLEHFDSDLLAHFLGDALDLWDVLDEEGDLDGQRVLLRALVGEIVVGREGGHFTLKSAPEWERFLKGPEQGVYKFDRNFARWSRQQKGCW